MKKSLRVVLCLLLTLVFLVGSLPASARVNPLEDELENQSAGFGDPFILKYNGMYYMYGAVSENGVNTTRVWSSKDLVTWEYHGICVEGANSTALYAPEVIYKDGLFIMQGAPTGSGHYFYTSTSPTGPFTCVTDNLGLKFDGTVFMDSDNKVYFVTPSTGAMMMYYMSDFLTLDFEQGSTILPASVAKAWTEGPTLFRRDGKYYLTYTGNHVWEDSYRVEYAISDQPDEGWTEPADNTLLLDIEGGITGLGHNSIFIGPDLDTYYITYHNLYETPSARSARRWANYDPIVWNGEKLVVQGPTSWEVDDPAMPDFYEYFDADLANWDANGTWTVADGAASASTGTLISKESTKDVFTAEYNLTGTADLLFSYKDDQNYGRVWVDSAAKQLKAELIVNGNVAWSGCSDLYSYYKYDALHTVRVQQTADALHIYLDGVDRIVYETAGLTGGKIGYRATGEVKASFTAFSHKALGSADGEMSAPIPGTIEAIHTQDTAASQIKVDAAEGEMGYALSLKAGGIASYNILPSKADTYSVGLRARSIAEGTKINLLVDGKKALEATLPATGSDGYRTLPLRGLDIPEGKRTLSVEIVSGSMELYELEINAQDEVTALSSDCTSAKGDDGAVFWKQYETMPSWTGGTLNYTDYSTFGKLLAGDLGWSDYTLSADITMTAGTSAGLLFRVAHADNGIRPEVSLNNQYYHQGYYVGLSDGKVTLEKHNFGDTKVLVTQSCAVSTQKSHNLKVTAVGDTFTVYVDGTEVLTYTDTEYPLLTGRAGIRAQKAMVSFDNFKLDPADAMIAVIAHEVDYTTPALILNSSLQEDSTGGEGDGTGNAGCVTDGSLPTGLIIGIAAGVVVIVAVVVVLLVLAKRKKGAAAATEAPAAEPTEPDSTDV